MKVTYTLIAIVLVVLGLVSATDCNKKSRSRSPSPRCDAHCPPGFTKNANGECVRNDDCQNPNCKNCPPGFTKNANGECVRNDDCEDPNACNHCPPGFTKNANGECVRKSRACR
ncbi:hypothetical protein NEPAR04_1707 [Nematocida parisii]|nr:hypothetical protein NEPAR03_0300 [Nematocida parisii]KAI5129884.1 hypothetical protein NEPAR08_1765 [Nematocida parisii]KAI5142967.1 hypothetical protein NEPAR04_1707 [Nematocida parisii]